MISELLSVKGWKLFSGVVLLNALVLFLSQMILLDEIVFFNTYSEQMTYDRSMELYHSVRSYSWVGYLIIPGALFLKFSIISILLFTGLFFSDFNKDISLGKIFRVVTLAEIAFITASLLKFFWFIIFAGNYTIDDISFFYPLSLANLFTRQEVAPWWIYPLQTVNLFQVFYVVLLSVGLTKVSTIKRERADTIILCTYIPAIVIWGAVIMFFSIDLQP